MEIIRRLFKMIARFVVFFLQLIDKFLLWNSIEVKSWQYLGQIQV